MKKGRKFGREKTQRRAMMNTLASSLIVHGSIETTECKAKELRSFVEKIITKSKAGGLANTRLVRGSLSSLATKKVFTEIAPKYTDRKGGYTRVIKLPRRISDGAKMAIIELV